MNFYPFHIGDFRSGTIYFSQLERWVYRDLIDVCYDTEGALPLDKLTVYRMVGARTDEHRDAVDSVLADKFVKSEAGYVQDRITSEISKYHKKADSARKANQIRWGSEEHLNSDAAQIATKNQEPVKEDKSLSPAKLPTCPANEVINLYHSILPSLPAVRLQSDGRKKAIGTFWRWVLTSQKTDGTQRATTATEALEWIGAYFRRANENDFLMGRNPQAGTHANWRCDFDFLLTEKGKKHVIEKTLETT